MNEVTIKGTKNTESKTFKVGEVWLVPTYGTVNYIAIIKDITDKQIIFETLAEGKIIKATSKQFSEHTKLARKEKDNIIEYIFTINPEYLR